MLLKQKQKDVEIAWLRCCGARARFDTVKRRSNRWCRAYFTRPASLIWPFAAGILLSRSRRSVPVALETTSILLSFSKVLGKAIPIIKRYLT